MGKNWFIGDTHFGDKNIILYENRPFDSVEEMNESIIKTWNSRVASDDTVFHLGDFISGCDEERTREIVNRLNGYKVLIAGNHDSFPIDFYCQLGFNEVSRYPIIFQDFWILSHFPMYVNSNMPYANIYAHVHNNPSYNGYSKQSFCVSLERPYMEFGPIEFERIKQLMGLKS